MSTNRLIEAVRAIIRAEFPDYTYTGIYEYAIQSIGGAFVSADPTDTTIPLPHIDHVELRPSLLGENVLPIVGQIILVGFVNGKQSRPYVISVLGTPLTSAFDASVSITIGGSGALPSARMTDAVLVAGFMAGNIVQGSLKVKVG